MKKYIHNLRFVLPLVAVCILCTGCPKVTVGQATHRRINRAIPYVFPQHKFPYSQPWSKPRSHRGFNPLRQKPLSAKELLWQAETMDAFWKAKRTRILREEWRSSLGSRLSTSEPALSFRGIDLLSADFDTKKLFDKIIDFELSFFGKPDVTALKGEQDWEKKVKAWGGWKATIEHWVAEGLVTR